MHLSGAIALSTGSVTTAGTKPENEDFTGVHIPDDETLVTKGVTALVADGVSAARAAKEASESAIRGFLADYYETPESWSAKTSGHRVLTGLNRWLCQQGQTHGPAERGCVTTFTAVIFKSQTAHLFHVGDTRAYRLRGGELEQLTNDHTTFLSNGDCHLNRALGLSVNLRIDYKCVPLAPGDLFILTSDGIHDFLRHKEMEGILTDPASPQDLADRLDAKAAAAGSNDNRSCLLLRVESLPDGEHDEVFRRLTELPFPPDLESGMLLDGLRVERLLHASSRSQLYVVSEPGTDRRLVMKTPSVNFADDPDYLERFALEQWIGQRTSHPNLARVLRPPRPPSCLYHLVELIDGQALDAWLEAGEHSIPEIIEVIRQIIDGTRALHRRETLHQDLKPANILVGTDPAGATSPGGSSPPPPLVKIIDYGSCRIAGINEIAVPFSRSSAPGTLDYSAPEYRLGIPPDTRSDLFSIAVITYHLLTGGAHPYGPRWDRARSRRAFSTLKYVPAPSHNPLVPPWLDAAMKKALAITPGNRHECMSEFLHDLQHPNPKLVPVPNLPLAERNPLVFWKLVALFFLIAWIVTLLI